MVVVLNIVVRNVDETVFRKFKAWAVEEGLNVGKALEFALREFLKKQRPAVKRPATIFDFKPVSCGQGSERTSMEIDKIVYGAEL